MIFIGKNGCKFVRGRVNNLDKKDDHYEYVLTFTDRKEGKKYTNSVKSEKKAKLEINDNVFVRIIKGTGKDLWFKYAHIEVSEDLAYLSSFLNSYFKKNESYANHIYNTFTSSIEKLNKIERKRGEPVLTTWYSYLSGAAYSMVNSYDRFVTKYNNFAEFTGLINNEKNYSHIPDKEDREEARRANARKFLRKWYYHVYTRILNMFGISSSNFNEDITDDKMVLNFLFNKKNPYLIPFISNNLCREIELTLDIDGIPESDKEKHKVMNMIAEKVMKQGSSFCPKKHVLRKFSWVTDDDELDMEYRFGLHVDRTEPDQPRYYIRGIKMIQDDFVRYITTIKQEPEDRRRIKPAVDSSFSNEQRDAITYALLNNVSCITGRAGTGKCLSPDTKVLMYDRSKKKAKDILIGDLLMGPDFTSREVISLASDIDLMYRVSYSDGYFECNQVHILTLFQISTLQVVDIELNQIDNTDDYLLIQVKDNIKLKKFKLTCLGIGPYNGFDLGNSDRRFLLADHIVTHNTRCIAELTKNILDNKCNCYMVSFTGKAVARMRDVLREHLNPDNYDKIAGNISTFHSLMYKQIEQPIHYLIVDEASMVPTPLFVEFIESLEMKNRLPSKIIFTGDNNQLDPISWGSLFYQVIKSQVVPVFQLTKNFRIDGSGNGVLVAANKILDDPRYMFVEEGREFLPMETTSSIQEVQEIGAMYKLCNKYNETCISISCYKNTVKVYNELLQEILQEGNDKFIDERYKRDNRRWYLGDKVVQKENYRDVMNGMSGFITEIGSKSIKVKFETIDDPIEYFVEDFSEVIGNKSKRKLYDKFYDADASKKNWIKNENTTKSLDLGYILTVNKAQGSEWDNIICVLSDVDHYGFVNREKIYTMVTRAKKTCSVIYRSYSGINKAANTRQKFRYDDTWKYLQAELPVISDPRLIFVEREDFPMVNDEYNDDRMPDDFDPLDFM